MRLFHITIAAEGRFPPLPDETARRKAIRVLLRVGAAHLVLFCVADEHLHLVVLCAKASVGRVAEAFRRAVSHAAGASFEKPHVRPVESRAHLERLLPYVLNQPVHHNLGEHPALYSGSCFQDLVGARALVPLQGQLRQVLPRLRQRELLSAVGLSVEDGPLVAVDAELVRRLGAHQLVISAAAALAADPLLRGQSRPVVRVRQAAARLGAWAGIAPREVAWALGLPTPSLRRLRLAPACSKTDRAVLLRLALLARVARSQQGTSGS